MKATIMVLASVLCVLFATIPTSLAQESEEACSARVVVYPVVKTAILDEASYTGVRVRHATPWERLDVIGSKRFGHWCWLQVSDGWLIDSARALSTEPFADIDHSIYVPSCFSASKAFVSGNMNIRSGASTKSPVAAKAFKGDAYDVLGSMQGSTWCWLKLDLGWMARTGRVRATKLPVEGSSEFVSQVEAALNWVENSAPEWYHFLLGAIDKIFETPDLNRDHCTGYAHILSRMVELGSCHAFLFQRNGLSAKHDQHELAVALAHEACHIYVYEAGVTYKDPKQEEAECEKYSVGVSVALDSYSKFGELTYFGEPAVQVVERLCSQGFRPELFCPTIQRL